MNDLLSGPGGAPTYQVSELAEIIHGLLEDSLPSLWVEGEVSNFSRPASGHWYFTLKDSQAQLRCAMFKNRNFMVRPVPQNGDRIRVRAKVDFYIGRGDLQLICEALEPAGEGALLAAFERLKKKLAAEGLFDTALKRPMPPLPRHIGVITSATGAAVQDIRSTLARRWPLATLWLWPVPVQGPEAPPALVKALRGLPALAPVDVILLGRGGGSLEDLWAFNDEAVVRAVRDCACPVVSGVGHEVDFTLTDFAADLRAPTPTGAAEQVSPDISQWQGHLQQQTRDLQTTLLEQLRDRQQTVVQTAARLQRLHPGRRLRERAQRLDELAERLAQAQQRRLTQQRQAQRPLSARLHTATPLRVIRLQRQQLESLGTALPVFAARGLTRERTRLEALRARLESLNPLAVLGRGYAIVSRADGQIARDAHALADGETVHLRLAQGSTQATVTSRATSRP